MLKDVSLSTKVFVYRIANPISTTTCALAWFHYWYKFRCENHELNILATSTDSFLMIFVEIFAWKTKTTVEKN